MYGLILRGGVFAIAFSYIVAWLQYIADSKGLSKYPGMTATSGITNLPYMILSSTGGRSEHLAKLHKTYPVIRTGPNALSFGDVRAIKDIYGDGTKCLKDDFYSTVAGTHFNLADVVDKKDHQRKRKIMCSAYAIKNLESWEFKVVDKVHRLFIQLDRLCSPP